LLHDYDGLKEFYHDGGITATGGEPLAQMEFLTELFTKAKERGIHTCLDTSGILFRPEKRAAFDQLMAVTDLVMLDIKHIDPEEHKKLTAQPNTHILEFADYLKEKKIPVWIRHVVVPGITLQEPYLRRLGAYLADMTNMKALDVLPYHTMGEVKYENLGIPYPLKGIEPATTEQAIWAKDIIMEALKEQLRKEKHATA
jgi:pyruvate formate lyase activating enzyme